MKYLSDHEKQRYELIDEQKKQPRIFIDKTLATKLIMDCRAISAHKCRTRLKFKQHDVILTEKQSVMTKIVSSLGGENMQTHIC